MPDHDHQPTREHLICAVAETSTLWDRYVLAVTPHDGGQWVIEHRSCGLFWDRHHTWTPGIANAARLPEDKARRLADRLAVDLITDGIAATETLRGLQH
ncbi:hypothetical protein [Micromonospora sp. NPDC049662]|uniref:hypothetical protein n=1 Tax=Micromonospora sp. NPDC049662 TaxID=3155397 RepID=UPI0034327894